MTELAGIAAWPDRLEALVAGIGPPLTIGRVVARCDSTQDRARELGLGAVVVAGRQTAGRGQRGAVWADTGDEGLALSVCLSATDEPERSKALAEAVVAALEELAPEELSLRRLTVKPPNDVLLDGRKLAGVLIEQGDGLAVIGIGINVSQSSWPDDLTDTAISLAQVGVAVDRIKVLEGVLPTVVCSWSG